MKLEIDDAISGEERKRQVLIKQVLYAMEKFENNRSKTAKFLGYTVRGMRGIFSRYPELKHLKGESYEKHSPLYKEHRNKWG